MELQNNHNSEFKEDEIASYARQISLPEIGLHGQKLLKSSSILCIGSGGLGSPLLLYLAAAGIGRIGIVDFDLVESSNLHRQVIHSSSWVGKAKVNSAKNRILEINPYSKVDTYQTILRKENALDLIKPYDIVCDCTDNFPSKYLINDACVILGKPFIYGSIGSFEGHATVFNLDSKSPNLRDFLPEPPPAHLLPSCAEGGVLGILPGLIGIIQATEVIKIITSNGNILNGRILIFNALKMKFKELNIRASQKNKDIKNLIEYEGFCFNKNITSNDNSIKTISIRNFKHLIRTKHEEFILIDVRSKKEHKLQSIDISHLFPLETIENGSAIAEIKKISKDKKVYIHCQTGKRSLQAIIKLKSYGIEGINLIGGIDAWTKIID